MTDSPVSGRKHVSLLPRTDSRRWHFDTLAFVISNISGLYRPLRWQVLQSTTTFAYEGDQPPPDLTL